MRRQYFLVAAGLLGTFLLVLIWHRLNISVAMFSGGTRKLDNDFRPKARLVAKEPMLNVKPKFKVNILAEDNDVRHKMSTTSSPRVLVTKVPKKKDDDDDDSDDDDDEGAVHTTPVASGKGSQVKQQQESRVKIGGHSAQVAELSQKLKTPKETRALYEKMIKRGMTPKDKKLALDLLEVFMKVADRVGIDYFLYSGTLLGSWRHHGVIPWDDDIDVLCDTRKRKEFEDELKKLKPKYSIASGGLRSKFFSPEKSYKKTIYSWKWPYLDVQYYRRNSTHLWDGASEFRDVKYKLSDIFPLHKRPYEKYWVNAPKNSLRILQRTFAKTSISSLDDCETWWYSHKEEKARGQVHASCDKFKNLIPFVHRRISDGKMEEVLMIGDTVLQRVVMENEALKFVTVDPFSLKESKKRRNL